MSNVVQMSCSCEYLVSRAARHRRAGRYDEAMALLTKAKNQFGFQEDIESETAKVYDEIGRDEDAMRCYLRVVRANGKHKADALFQLSVSAAQKGDFNRSVSYYQQLTAIKQSTVPADMAALLGRQLREEMEKPFPANKRARAEVLEQRAVACLQAGKTVAAKRDVLHALRLFPNAQRYTLLACCHLLLHEMEAAVITAERAHSMSPAHVQTMCVLSDAYAAAGDRTKSRRMLFLAALRAQQPDDLFAAAMESAKHGEDILTLRLTNRLLKREPFHTQAMMLHGCALVNLGRMQQASRIFGRLCGLAPEDTVCEWLHKLTRVGKMPQEKMELGGDVSAQEGSERVSRLISMLYSDPVVLREDGEALRMACRLSAWAFRSLIAGSHGATVALILMTGLDVPQTREVLLDAVMDPGISDAFKAGILQVLSSKEGFKPYDVDFGGRLVRLAAGGVSEKPVRGGEINQKIVQRACDALMPDFPDAPQVLLPVFLQYLKRYEAPQGRMEDACAAALEYVYHVRAGRQIGLDVIAERYGVSMRLCAMCARRMSKDVEQGSALAQNGNTDSEETQDEVY